MEGASGTAAGTRFSNVAGLHPTLVGPVALIRHEDPARALTAGRCQGRRTVEALMRMSDEHVHQ